jgi:pimeloyl-ACP methyl ester carboxylesterase
VSIVFDRGEGPPVVVVPGLHGRWEWARPALRRLAERCRAISYSLSGDIGSQRRVDETLGFDDYVLQLDEILDRAEVSRAAICGVSFGGFVAVHYAALHPDRVSALILASAPGPGYTPSAQQSRWLSRPWLSAPGFVCSAPFRLWPELTAAFPALGPRMGFLARQALRCVTAPMLPPLMASRIHTVATIDFAGDCARIAAPTLILSGEDELDRVVPVGSTRTYASLIEGAEYKQLRRTGHMGMLTQPSAFADIVSGFVHAHHH